MLEKKLNALLANYEVMLHKLQAYHWYVRGKTFFADHAQFETYYDQAAANVDAIAESILMIGGKPLANMREMLDATTIDEAERKPVTSEEAYKTVRKDFQMLLECATDVKRTADEKECFLISAMIDGVLAQLHKDCWMLDQVLAG